MKFIGQMGKISDHIFRARPTTHSMIHSWWECSSTVWEMRGQVTKNSSEVK